MLRRAAETALALAFVGVSAAHADTPMSEKQLAALMERLAKVPERQATFHEEKTLAALNQPIASAGRLVYRRPNHLEKLTTEPVAERLVVEGDKLTIAMGKDPSRTFDLGAAPELQALVDTVRGTLAGDLKTLQRYYTIAGEGTGSSWRLTLTPATPLVARFVRQVVVDGTATNPTLIQIVQANGDEQRMFIEPGP
jgi:outer membrane lipoprotein-sorting protein